MSGNDPYKSIATTHCKTWDEYCRAHRLGDEKPLDPIYRGHAQTRWALTPQSAREHGKRPWREDVRIGPAPEGQTQLFKGLATGLPGIDLRGLEEVDIETLARHHGLSSNLLDWTNSPFIAAFFAFTAALDQANGGRLTSGTLDQAAVVLPTEPVCIWRLACGNGLWVEGEFVMLNSLSPINYWQKAQKGLFTRLTHKHHIDIVTYLNAHGKAARLHRFVVDGSETGKALSDLEAMNITYATLFPDLRGAALQANVGPTWRFLGSSVATGAMERSTACGS